MMLIDESEVTETIFPVDALKRHLRLGSGFAEDDLQDAVLLSFVRAASVAISSGSIPLAPYMRASPIRWGSSTGSRAATSTLTGASTTKPTRR